MQIIKKNYFKIFFLRLFLFILSLLWFAGILSPCLLSDSNFFLNQYLRFLYSTVCHQDSTKTILCNHSGLLVCSRCTGIYLSVAVISFILLFLKIRISISIKFLILFLLPMLLDVILYSLNFYEYSKLVAAITGFLFGSAVFLYILEAFENYLYNISEK